jgi:hypothetical protein
VLSDPKFHVCTVGLAGSLVEVHLYGKGDVKKVKDAIRQVVSVTKSLKLGLRTVGCGTSTSH